MTKITVDKALIEQAFDALQEIAWSNDSKWQSDRAQSITEPLSEALAEPVVEPAAYRYKYLNHIGEEVWSLYPPLLAQVLETQALYASPTPPAEHLCKWPTCQTEEYQKNLADQIAQELVGEPPAEVPLTDDQYRPEFEAFVNAELGDVAVTDQERYISPKIQNYWRVWQAAIQKARIK